jgi:microcin C transport system permease protein
MFRSVSPLDTIAPAERAPPTASEQALAVLSPGQRAWRRFKRNRLGYLSFRVVLVLLAISIAAPPLSNEHPLLARYQGKLYFPILFNPPETEFGGDSPTPTSWLDPSIQEKFSEPGNWVIFTLNRYSGGTINFASKELHPAPPRPKTGSAPMTAVTMCSRVYYTDLVSASRSLSD